MLFIGAETEAKFKPSPHNVLSHESDLLEHR